MTPDRWSSDDDDDPVSLARRLEHVIDVLERATGAPCDGCGAPVCGHHVLLSLVAGYEDAPLCPGCLASDLDRGVEDVRAGLHRYLLTKQCLREGWRMAGVREGVPDGTLPGCTWASASASASTSPSTSTPTPSAASSIVSPHASTPASVSPPAASPAVHDTWDAGDLGCGELVLELRRRLRRMPPGAVLALRATDSGAPEDIPAWCRLTGNALVSIDHPEYRIRRKD